MSNNTAYALSLLSILCSAPAAADLPTIAPTAAPVEATITPLPSGALLLACGIGAYLMVRRRK
jgi:hypothetical protein